VIALILRRNMSETHSLSTELCVQIVQAHSRHVHTVASACLHAHTEPAAVHSVIRIGCTHKKKQRSILQLLKNQLLRHMTNQSLVAGMYITVQTGACTTRMSTYWHCYAALVAKHCTFCCIHELHCIFIGTRLQGSSCVEVWGI
jgi:hypothetical protein